MRYCPHRITPWPGNATDAPRDDPDYKDPYPERNERLKLKRPYLVETANGIKEYENAEQVAYSFGVVKRTVSDWMCRGPSIKSGILKIWRVE